MTDSGNVLEVITKGRVLCDEPVAVVEGQRSDSQLSLEPLPPEAPYYGGPLYEQLQTLSEQLHSEQESLGQWEDASSEVDHTLSTDDPKLRKAIEKMKRLDERLAALEERERELKRQRREGDHTPVFPTQVLEESDPLTAGDKPTEPTRSSTTDRGDKAADPVGTNFIKRNIELASDAGALVAMTESEKARLEELVGGADDEGEETALTVYNTPDQGFTLDQENSIRMSSIDRQLQAMLSTEDWEHLTSPGNTAHNQDPAVRELRISHEKERLREIDERLQLVQDSHLALPLPRSELQHLLETCTYEHQ